MRSIEITIARVYRVALTSDEQSEIDRQINREIEHAENFPSSYDREVYATVVNGRMVPMPPHEAERNSGMC